MRKIFVLISIILSLNACEKKGIELSDCLTVEKGFCGKMCLDANKGSNLPEAIEAIKFEGIRSNYSTLNYELQELKGVKNESGQLVSEKFFSILFIDPETGLKVHSLNDVISETGNHYIIHWCED